MGLCLHPLLADSPLDGFQNRRKQRCDRQTLKTPKSQRQSLKQTLPFWYINLQDKVDP